MTQRVYLSFILLLSVFLFAFGCNKKTSGPPPTDTTPPEVISVNPYDGQMGVPVDDSIVVTWSEPVNWPPDSDSLFHLAPPAAWTSDSRQDKIIFTLNQGFEPGTEYTASLSSEIEDKAGNALGSDYTWTFSTEESLPGITWTKHQLSVNNALNSIARSDDVYVAVGTGGLVVRSTDGNTWDEVETPAASDLHKVIWADTLFIAVGGSEIIMTSADGLDWAVRRSGVAARSLHGIVYTGELYVAVGGHFTSPPSMLADVRTSTDAIVWTPELLDEAGSMNGIVWTGERFIAVGCRRVNTYAVWTSETGHEWVLRDTVNSDASFYEDVAWSGSTAIATGFDQTDLLCSSDGLKWNTRELALNHSSRAVGWTGNQFIAVGHFGHIFTSTDGTVWTSHDSGISSDLYGVWGSIESLAAVGGSIILTSP